jgi:hypothetical protein
MNVIELTIDEQNQGSGGQISKRYMIEPAVHVSASTHERASRLMMRARYVL